MGRKGQAPAGGDRVAAAGCACRRPLAALCHAATGSRGLSAVLVRACAAVMLVALAAGACTTFVPPPPADPGFVERVQRQSDGHVHVSAVVTDAAENTAVFGAGLLDKGIQPIWLEIENHTTEELVVLLLSIDPNYFSPAEAAWKIRSLGERGFDARIQYMLEQHIPVTIAPRSQASGFVYANVNPGMVALAVDLLGESRHHSFEFLLPVPGFEADFFRTRPSQAYRPEEIVDLDLDGLRAYLEGLPCCALGGDRETPGDPLNLVIVGDGIHVLTALARQGWDLTETLSGGSATRTAFSSLFGSKYRTSPVSPLYLFDRPQDAALQKARETVDERNHLRLWRAPVSLDDTPVWVGQISRDIGVKFSSKTFVTHKIDPVVDEARFYLLQDLATSQFVSQAGYVKGVGYVSPAAPRFNYTDDPYYTDGLRAVLILSADIRSLEDLEWLDWEVPPSSLE